MNTDSRFLIKIEISYPIPVFAINLTFTYLTDTYDIKTVINFLFIQICLSQ